MKTLVLTSILAACLVSQTANAVDGRVLDWKFENCKDANFNGLKADHYSKIRYHNRFQHLYTGNSPAPAGIEPLVFDGAICYATTATYLKHKSGKIYVMFTTGDDYCDGGNTTGAIVDTELYRDKQSIAESVVGEINDGEPSCVAKQD